MTLHRISTYIVLAAASALLAWPKTSLGADKPAVYTAAQASQGTSLFSKSCAGCHGVNLEGVAAPPLAGAAFTRSWQGKSADDLFYIMSHDMPADNPGSLTQDQYVAILAYVLQKNGYPAGSTALDPSKLKGITITQ
ncbi:MAG TPA: cytochrome c [Candidatus Acidoferrales bacterium]|nr:cytochrome c [Candidatus Acidoferrales bacterium]